MNPGLAEETAKVAQSAVTGLSRSPLALAMMLFNLLVFGGIFWLIHEGGQRQDLRFERIMQSCFDKLPPKVVP